MRPGRLLGGAALLMAYSAAIGAENPPNETAIVVPEVEVRSGPSPKYYATGKLRQGERVQVLREEPGDWLAIKPPAGSFSWINTRFLDRTTQTGQVLGADVPVRIGSELTNDPPTVQQIKLQRGAQVVILDAKTVYSEDGSWVPISPPPQEVRYIPASAVKNSQVQTAKSSPSSTTYLGPEGGAAPSEVPLWQQAQQAEQANNPAEAEHLYLQLARQTTDHNLALRCWNRIYFIREGNRALQPYAAGRPADGYSPNPNGGRLVPMPVYPYGQPVVPYGAARPGQFTSQYTYQRDNPQPPIGQTPPVGYGRAPAPQPVGAAQSSGPGWLRRSPFWLDQKATYVLESSNGMPRLYVTAQPGVNLDPYVNRTVDLWGPIVYRGDVKTNYMSVLQVRPLQP